MSQPLPAPPTSDCILHFEKALAYFEVGFNAAGYNSILEGIACLYQRGLLTKKDLRKVTKMSKKLMSRRQEK